jgi:hypothetical protein
MLSAYAFLVGEWLSGQPLVTIIAIAINIFAVFFFLLTYVPQQLGKLYPRPFAVSVPSIITTGGTTHRNNVQISTYIINRSLKNRVILEFAICLRSADGQESRSQQPELHDINPGLGPQEHTEGVIAFNVSPVGDLIPTDPKGLYIYDGTIRISGPRPTNDKLNGIYLHVIDRLSGRDKCFRIPGSYPQGYFAPPTIIPSGTSSPPAST